MLYNTVLIYGHLERLQCSTHCFESRLLFSTHVPKLQNSCAALQLQRCHHVEQMFLHPLSFTSTDGNARKSLVSIVVFSFATSTLPVSLINFKSLINFQFDTAIVYLDCALVDTMSGTWPVIGVRFPPRDLLQQYWLLCEEEVHFFAYLLQFSSTASGKKRVSSLLQFSHAVVALVWKIYIWKTISCPSSSSSSSMSHCQFGQRPGTIRSPHVFVAPEEICQHFEEKRQQLDSFPAMSLVVR